jgi:hypothetical protein
MGLFGKSVKYYPDEILRASVFTTMAQAFSLGRQTPVSIYVNNYSKLFSAIVSRAYKEGLISRESFLGIKYLPFNILVDENDYELFYVDDANRSKYLEQGLALNKVLSRWKSSMNVGNADQSEVFGALVSECKNLGMSKDDEEMIGLLFLDSVFFTTVLKDSQKDKTDCDRNRSIGTFFATELPNRWLIEKARLTEEFEGN